MGSKSKQTIGYRYLFGTHMGVGLAIDELVEIEVGDRQAWSGSITDNTTIEINQPLLFGGDEKEGGIVGTLSVLMGRPGQAVLPALAAMLGGLVPAFRGAATLFYDGLMCSGSPYPKPWRFRVRRATSGWEGDAWYPEKAVIWMADGAVRAMNPAHILYECWTNSEWGRGADASRLHDAQWRSVADKLHAEGFGLCFKWSRTDSIESFMQEVVNHIGGQQYVDPDSAKVVLELIRDDYDPVDLPLYTPDTGLLGIDDDATGSQASGTNEVILKWRDPVTRSDRSTRVKNPGSIHSGSGVATTTVEYLGIPTAELARRVAMRDLRAASGFIKRFKIRLDRRAYQLAPGKVFRVSDPARGIANMVLRAGRVEKGSLSAGTITVTALQDVFGLPSTTYVGVQPPAWTPPDTTPQPITLSRLVEVPYRELVQSTDAANMALIDDTAGYVVALATKPTPLAMGFNLLTRVGTSGPFTSKASDESFCPSSTLVGALSRVATLVVVLPSPDLRQVSAGTAALIGDEIVRIDSIDPDTGSITLARGCADTVPASHLDGARIWFYDDFAGGDPTEYSTGVTVQALLLTRTGTGELAEGSAPTISKVLEQRLYRPYPPANFQINGAGYPASASGMVTVSWAHRDRVIQGDQLIDTSLSSIGPEPGTTYGVTVYNDATEAVVDTAIVSGTTYTLPVDGDVHYGDVALLVHFDGADGSVSFADSSSHNHIPTVVGDTHIVSADGPFVGRASGLFDGAGDRLVYPSSALFNLGATYSIEVRLCPFSLPPSGNNCRVLMFGVNGSSSALQVAIVPDGGILLHVPSSGTTQWLQSPAGTITLNEWHVYSFFVDSGVGLICKDGVPLISPSPTRVQTGGAVGLVVGFDTVSTVNYNYQGKMAELRITNAVSRQSGAYTVSDGPFPNGVGSPPGSRFRVEVESVRDGLASLQKQSHTFDYV